MNGKGRIIAAIFISTLFLFTIFVTPVHAQSSTVSLTLIIKDYDRKPLEGVLIVVKQGTAEIRRSIDTSETTIHFLKIARTIVKVYYKEVLVAEEDFDLIDDTSLTIVCKVFNFRVFVRDTLGNPVGGLTVKMYSIPDNVFVGEAHTDYQGIAQFNRIPYEQVTLATYQGDTPVYTTWSQASLSSGRTTIRIDYIAIGTYLMDFHLFQSLAISAVILLGMLMSPIILKKKKTNK